ncbi:MAG: protein translocase subunit SecD, partial [Deltaproteobacteria bacterium]
MTKKLQWRGLIVLAVLVIALIYLTPSLSKTLPTWWPNLLPEDKINLGLDLKGGMHLILEVQAQKAVESHLERMVEDIKYSLRKDKIRYQELSRSGPDRIGL